MEVRDEGDAHHQEQLKSSPNHADTHSVTQRLQRELMALMMTGGIWEYLPSPRGRAYLRGLALLKAAKELYTRDKWSSAYDCRTNLLSIPSLLGEPNTESPLNTSAALLWRNQEEYRKTVHKHYMAGESLGTDPTMNQYRFYSSLITRFRARLVFISS